MRSWANFKEDEMMKEAEKQQWDMFEDISKGEELDKATHELHDTINKVMDKQTSTMCGIRDTRSQAHSCKPWTGRHILA